MEDKKYIFIQFPDDEAEYYDYEDLDPSNIVTRRFRGYKKTPEYEVDEDCSKTEKITVGAKTEAVAQTAVLEKALIKVQVYLDSAGAIEEALPSGDFEDKYDDQTIEEWYDFVANVEALIERNGKIVKTSNSKQADSLSTYIDFYKVDKDGNREDGLVDLRISDHKATQGARINRKRKAQKIDSNVIFKTIIVNNKVFKSYEEALEYLKNVILKFDDSSKENKEDLKGSEDTMDKKEQLKEFIKNSVKALTQGTATNCRLKLDDRLAVFVGWSEGFGDEDRDDVIQATDDKDYGICAGIKVWTSDDMWTDFDYLNFPYTEEEVYDLSTSIGQDDVEDNFNRVAQFLVDCYDEVKDFEIEEDGEIITEETVEESCTSKKLKENEYSDIGGELSEYQKWVDYDMKRYGKVSDNTFKKIKEVGCTLVKDKYGDWEVIAKRKNEGMTKRKSNQLKEYWKADDVINDLADRAFSIWKDQKDYGEEDAEEAVSQAMDEGLIYDEDIFNLAANYLRGGDILDQFYEDAWNDVYTALSALIDDEEDEDEDEDIEESCGQKRKSYRARRK